MPAMSEHFRGTSVTSFVAADGRPRRSFDAT
jgi:hypothetical protein